MKELIERCIHWEALPGHSRQEYQLSVSRAVLNGEKKQLQLELCLNFIIPHCDLDQIREALLKEFPMLLGVVFRFHYEKVIHTPQEIASLAVPHMIDEVNGQLAHLTKTIFPDQICVQENRIEIMALGDVAVEGLNEKVAKQFSAILSRDFSWDAEVVFQNNSERYQKTAAKRKEAEALEMAAIESTIQEAEKNGVAKAAAGNGGSGSTGSGFSGGNVGGGFGGGNGFGGGSGKGQWKGGGARTAKYTPVSGNRIMGKPIKESPVKVDFVNQESGMVVIEGTVFGKDSRQTKTGKRIVTLLVTDYSNSICVKIFASEEKWGDIDQHIQNGDRVKIRGGAEYDTFENAVVIMGKDLEKLPPAEKRQDNAAEKRTELHIHTKMSAMDGMIEVSDLVKTAGRWGHKALAITDHGVVQSFPEAYKVLKKNKLDMKLIFGMEGYLLDDGGAHTMFSEELTTDGEYIAFDLETTGLSSLRDEIIEIGAVKIKGKEMGEQFRTFVRPNLGYIPDKITELTGITWFQVKDAPSLDEVLPQFMEFIGDLPLVAHNADFDVSFIKEACEKRGRQLFNQKVDSLFLSRKLLPQLKRHKLNQVAKELNVSLENHHRAVDDAVCCGGILLRLFEKLEEKGVTRLCDMDRATGEGLDYKTGGTNHVILLAKNQIGLKNLYKLVSLSHLEYFYKKPRIPKSVLRAHREGILVGSACEAGEVYQAILNKKSSEELEKLLKLYDYLEIQPLINNRFLIEKGKVSGMDDLREINRKIIALGKKYDKPVVATTDAHYMEQEEAVYRNILMAGMGFKDAEDGGEGLYFRTTEEMLQEFSYLGSDLAHQVVIDDPNRVADWVEDVIPVPEGKFPPKIEGAEEKLYDRCMENAHRIYGDPLPDLVQKRLERELNSIISNGYAVMYVSAELLVQKSLSDGYLVGSRGSVGSSFAATMGGITEVNPLPPHYVCDNPECKHSEFILDGSYDCGVDMPEKLCPQCGRPYRRDGFNIPFEVFLGFEGDKEPDIDLNFAGEYQPVAHKYVEEIFGRENVFRAGTIGTVATKTAFGFVMKYFEEKGQTINKWEVERLAEGCTGVRRTTGQHPGGIIIVPKGHEIYEFCPVQHPANDMNTDIITTHYDYHSIDENLLKLDILGHDGPSMIRQLQDLTGMDPITVPLRDKKVDSIFNGIEGLEIKAEDYRFTHGTYGIPEFGTKFVRQMLDDTKPSKFADLVRISGFSHGTDVWINNAQEFIRSGEATMTDAISTRDDIMNYLIHKGVPNKTSFKIMECVRKGKGLTDEQVQVMEENDVPQWYIESCRRIKYMFPKAHAVAYVMTSYRMAYYKVYHPVPFYAVFFTTKIADFNAEVILKGMHAVWKRMQEIDEKGRQATKKEEDEVTVLEVAYEMYARGYEFLSVDLERSDATRFQVEEGKVLLPFLALSGMGEKAARLLAEEAKKGEFFSVADMKTRAKLNKTAMEALSAHGVLSGLPESNQLCLF